MNVKSGITPQEADGFFPALSHFITLLLDWLRPGT
jgi:hypothetical protein